MAWVEGENGMEWREDAPAAPSYTGGTPLTVSIGGAGGQQVQTGNMTPIPAAQAPEGVEGAYRIDATGEIVMPTPLGGFVKWDNQQGSWASMNAPTGEGWDTYAGALREWQTRPDVRAINAEAGKSGGGWLNFAENAPFILPSLFSAGTGIAAAGGLGNYLSNAADAITNLPSTISNGVSNIGETLSNLPSNVSNYLSGDGAAAPNFWDSPEAFASPSTIEAGGSLVQPASALENLNQSINDSNYGVSTTTPQVPVVERGVAPASTGAVKTAAGSAGTASSLAKILDGSATAADYLSVLGTAGSTALGIFGSKDAADSYRSLSEQSRNDRLPFLNKSLEWLNNPESFYSGPGKAGLDANLRALSATHGNPIGSPTALGIATEAGMRDWRNAVTGFGNIGLSGEDTRMQLGSNAIKADGGVYNALGSGLADLTTPKRSSLEDLLKSMGTKFSLA